MPKPTTIVDRVALEEAKMLRQRSGVGHVRLERMLTPARAKQELRRQRDLGGLPARYLRELRPPTRTWLAAAVTLAWCALCFGFALMPPGRNQLFSWLVFVCLAPVAVLGMVWWSKWRPRGSPIAGARYLRVRPLHRLLRASAMPSMSEAERAGRAGLGELGEHASRVQATLDHRLKARTAMSESERVTNAMVPGSLASNLSALSALGFVAIIALFVNVPARAGNIVPVMLLYVIVLGLWSQRRTYSKGIEIDIAAKRCPACKFACDALPTDPQLAQLGVLAGPTRCPECGMLWPFVPPPTPEEMLRAAPGDEPGIVMSHSRV